MVFPKSNLPSGSVPWGREVQKRIEDTDSKLASLGINDRSDTKQLQDSYRRLDLTVQKLAEADVKIIDAVELATTASTNAATAAQQANDAITALGKLDESTSTYKINADNITVGNLTGITLTGNTIKSAATGTRVEMNLSKLDFWYGSSYVGRLQGNSGTYATGLQMISPSEYSVWSVSDSSAIGWFDNGSSYSTLILSGNGLDVSAATTNIGRTSGTVNFYGRTWANGGAIIYKAENISGNNANDQGPLVIKDGSYYMKLDGNEISSYVYGGAGANLYLNGSGSSGAIILGDGGGATSVRNALNAQNGILVTGAGITASVVAANNIGATGNRDLYTTTAGAFGYATSSRRFKRDIENLALNVDAILNISPVSFKYKHGALSEDAAEFKDAVQWGFIAEDLHDAGLTGLVDYDPETGEVEGLKYGHFVIALQAVVREQANQIKALSDRIDTLEGK
jgi:hypothetical protein